MDGQVQIRMLIGAFERAAVKLLELFERERQASACVAQWQRLLLPHQHWHQRVLLAEAALARLDPAEVAEEAHHAEVDACPHGRGRAAVRGECADCRDRDRCQHDAYEPLAASSVAGRSRSGACGLGVAIADVGALVHGSAAAAVARLGGAAAASAGGRH